MNHNQDDQVFWDRVADMPSWEAEQECVLRRENNSLQMAMLRDTLNLILERTKGTRNQEAKRIGVEIANIGAQNTLLNERIKYLRNLQTKVSWRMAVETLFGIEAVEQCKVWLVQNEVSYTGRHVL